MERIQVTPASSSLVRTTYTVLLYFKVLSILLLEGQQNLGEGYSYHSPNTHITPISPPRESVLVANALQQILSFFKKNYSSVIWVSLMISLTQNQIEKGILENVLAGLCYVIMKKTLKWVGRLKGVINKINFFC